MGRRRRGGAAGIPYTTTYIEKVDTECVVIRGMFGGEGRTDDKRKAKAQARALCSVSGPMLGPKPPKNQQKMMELTSPDRPRGPFASAGRALYMLGRCCWVGCCPPLPSPIIHKIVFQPPSEPSYAFRGADGRAADPGDPAFLSVAYSGEPVPMDLSELRGFFVRSARGSQVAGAYLPSEGAPLLFIYSHANAMDIGFTIPLLYKLRRKLGCAVLTYDYSGYGLSSGSCRERNLYADVEAVFAFATGRLGWPTNRIVAYGFSLGTAATAYLAVRQPRLAAVVLAGAFISAINCIRQCASDSHYPCEGADKFRTYERIPLIEAPTLVLHGLTDDITHFGQGLWILERCVVPLQPLFLPDTTHNDMDKPPIWSRLRELLSRDLGLGHPFPKLSRKFGRLLLLHVDGLDVACVASGEPCSDCAGRLAAHFFNERRMGIIGLDPSVAAGARLLRWEVEPRSGSEGGSWEARFTLVVSSPLLSAPEVRRYARRLGKTLPDPPAVSPTPLSANDHSHSITL